MKYALLLIITIGCLTAAAKPFDQLDSLLSKREFFRLRDELQSNRYRKLPEARKLYYQAFVYNFFHDLPASSNIITLLLNKYSKQFTDKEIGILLTRQIDNHVKLYQYKQAHEVGQLLLGKYAHTLSVNAKDDIANSDIIWKGLADVAPQRTAIDNDTYIAYKRDVAGLINIPVHFGDSTFQFVFDTGANLSVISETYAAKSNVRLLNTHFQVRAITGIQVMANLGVAATMKIGDITVNNVVFIVFPDSALSFGRGVYKINGIIGFPVIEQMQEIRITKDTMAIPREAEKKDIGNFGLDELTPILNAGLDNDTLSFTFDTGAQTTVLNEPYYQKHKAAIEKNGKAVNIQEGGAGGTQTSKAYKLPNVTFMVDAQPAPIKNISVKTTSSGTRDNFYYGNLGQDVMTQFHEMIINFRYMYVRFVK